MADNVPSGPRARSPANPVRARPEKESVLALLAGVGGLVAGGIHLGYSPGHFSESNGQGLFFLGLGTIQVGWGVWHLRRPSQVAWTLGVAISTAAILTYVAALLVQAPFTHGPEPLDYAGLFTKCVEGFTIVALCLPVLRAPAKAGGSRSKAVVATLVGLGLGVAGAASAMGAGYALEPLAPTLSEPSAHSHGTGGEVHDETPSPTPTRQATRSAGAL